MSSHDRTFEVKEVKTRKDHNCTFCGNTIFAGENCHVWIGVYEGKIARVHSHSECNNLWDGEDYCPGEAMVPEAVRLRNLEHVFKFK